MKYTNETERELVNDWHLNRFDQYLVGLTFQKLSLWDIQCCQTFSGKMKNFKNGPIPASFRLFRSFLVTISIQIEKSLDSVLGIWAQGCKMLGADQTTELWRPPLKKEKLLDVAAALAQWIRLHLPSSRPGFESQAQQLNYIYFN